MKTIRVPLNDRSYAVHVGSGILARALRAVKGTGDGRAFVIADSRLRPHSELLAATLKAQGWSVAVFFVPAREEFKDFRRVYPLYGKLLKAGASRHSVLFALGGGVIGDAVGFIAATYLRGIQWVGVPTTLLAQVDSSIGGKTGVNHEAGKNLIGAFHQPLSVVCEIEFLKTLPRREIISGFGEMVKYGLIYDPLFFDFLRKSWKRLSECDDRTMADAIARCARWKARAVAQDELDRKGIREVLNFGHTVGHAFEGATDYGYFRHGEAVILGMRAAIRISRDRGHLGERDFREVDSFLKKLPLPELPKKLSSQKLLSYVRRDKKKAKDGRIRFVLLKRIGRTILDAGVTEAQVQEAIESL